MSVQRVKLGTTTTLGVVKAGICQNGSVNGNIGTYTTLWEEHQHSIIQAAPENAHAIRRRFDDVLARYAWTTGEGGAGYAEENKCFQRGVYCWCVLL